MGPEDSPVCGDDLLCRWPDPSLTATFHGFLAIYRSLCAEEVAVSGERAVRAGYERLCAGIYSAMVRGRGRGEVPASRPRQPREAQVLALLLALRQKHESDWLQRLASILAMLMHFALDVRTESLLVNRRRQGKPFTTYPTSPGAARLVAEIMVSSLLEGEIPATCQSASAAERFAERALAFRVLDPSTESGQLLLEIAQAILRRVHRQHRPGTREARFLERALLEKLCRDCLWSIDRNELAIPAFELVIALLGAEHGIPKLKPQHVFAADVVDLLSGGGLPKFDGVINNPPWGEGLAPAERERLRSRFRSLQHRTDTYVSFSELAIGTLRQDGAFAMILPSQALTARNSAGLRELLVDRTRLDRIVLLPRAAFGDATVRGLVVAGRAHPAAISGSCRATIYRPVKRMSSMGSPRSFDIPHEAFRRIGSGSWSRLLTGGDRMAGWGQTVPLRNLAIVAPGVQLYGAGRGDPRQTPEVVHLRPFTLAEPGPGATPAIRGREVQPFFVLDPKGFVSFGDWLARVGDHAAYRRGIRVFVRELCRRDGRLSAAVARDGFIPLHGVLTVVPSHIDPRALVGILNSGSAAEYVQAHAASFYKVDFQRITVGELRQMPMPVAALDAAARAALGLGTPSARERGLRSELIRRVDDLSRERAQASGAAFRLDRLDAVVAALFAGPGAAR